jgi:hypothetical protein
VGKRTGKAYPLGNPIKVKLIAARVAEKELDLFGPKYSHHHTLISCEVGMV